LADFILLSIPMCVLFITWFGTPMEEFFTRKAGLSFFLVFVFQLYLIAFSYIFSYSFRSPKSCVAVLPILVIVLLIVPDFIFYGVLVFVEHGAALGVFVWIIMLFSPHGALIVGLLDIVADFSSSISAYPPVEATLILMIAQTVCYLGLAYWIDISGVKNLDSLTDPNFNENCLNGLDEDVKVERETLSKSAALSPLRIERLRKVYPPKRQGGKGVVATQDVSFHVQKGEIFGLLGANGQNCFPPSSFSQSFAHSLLPLSLSPGAGKTTTISMLTRHIVPTSGNAFIANHSILNDFKLGSTHLGVVTQSNSLWDMLSVQHHLKLFARLRGVPEDIINQVVLRTLKELELEPHGNKLAGQLSGGMKRKVTFSFICCSLSPLLSSVLPLLSSAILRSCYSTSLLLD
jgi:ATP-binding cassette, subfamily A (ABC1), member 3